MVWRSLENEGSVESNCALSKPSETKTSVTKSPEPPTTGSLWQPEQELESGPLVRVNAGLTPNLRLVGTIACVALGRPAPSSVVNLALKSSRPRAISAWQRRSARCRDGVEIHVGRKDLLVPAPCQGRARGAARGDRRPDQRAEAPAPGVSSSHPPSMGVRRQIAVLPHLGQFSGNLRVESALMSHRQFFELRTSELAVMEVINEQGNAVGSPQFVGSSHLEGYRTRSRRERRDD